MYLASLDNKRGPIALLQGATVKKSDQSDQSDSWYLNLNGPSKNFAIVPDTFDSCIIDPDSLCPFGFTISAWFKFNFNAKQIESIQRNRKIFKQILFYTGSSDLSK